MSVETVPPERLVRASRRSDIRSPTLTSAEGVTISLIGLGT